MTFTTFNPHPLLRDGHAMTIAPMFWHRPLVGRFQKTALRRVFRVSEDTQVIAQCHWQPEPTKRPTLVVLHGLEGSAESHYVIGIAYKAFACGMNAIRLNMRNCGGSMDLTPTLYNAGLSGDLHSVLHQLCDEGFQQIMISGYSLGGNVVLKTAGELGSAASSMIAGVAAISPSIDLDLAVQAIESKANRIYEYWFLRTLKQKIREKALLFPQSYDLTGLEEIKGIRAFDDRYTSISGGYKSAADYYARASAINFIPHIEVPTLIVAAADDPMVPFVSFESQVLRKSNVHLLSTRHGGHTGFIQRSVESQTFDHFWAENRIISFCQEVVYGRQTI